MELIESRNILSRLRSVLEVSVDQSQEEKQSKAIKKQGKETWRIQHLDLKLLGATSRSGPNQGQSQYPGQAGSISRYNTQYIYLYTVNECLITLLVWNLETHIWPQSYHFIDLLSALFLPLWDHAEVVGLYLRPHWMRCQGKSQTWTRINHFSLLDNSAIYWYSIILVIIWDHLPRDCDNIIGSTGRDDQCWNALRMQEDKMTDEI